MLLDTKRAEIDEHTSKLIVGVIAICLASATSFFSSIPLQSISASYHEGGWSRDIFVGFLFAIAAFLFSYNGKSPYQRCQMVLSKVGAFAAVGVAMFPCKCGTHAQVIPYVHGGSAAVMFLTLAIFCYLFFRRAWNKGYWPAKFRALIYALCGITILVCISILAMDNIFDGIISSKISRLTFWGEATGLFAFGVAWLTASRTIPLLTSKMKKDRFLLFREEADESSRDAS